MKGAVHMKHNVTRSQLNEQEIPIETAHAAELFSKLSEQAQDAIIDLLKSLLSDE